MHVDIFQALLKGQIAALQLPFDLDQSGFYLTTFVRRQQSDVDEHLGVRDRAGDVMGEESMIEADTFGEGFNFAIGRLLEDTATGRTGHGD